MKKITKMFQSLICFGLIAQLAGCGTLMYPERRGQKGGRLDIGIVALDTIGLLFFLIPGIIAFAVDFSEGTIYLPGGARAARFDPKHATFAKIEEIILKETGQSVKLNQANMEVSRLESLDDMRTRFAAVSSGDKNIRLALNTK